jgi:hypothetical protein
VNASSEFGGKVQKWAAFIETARPGIHLSSCTLTVSERFPVIVELIRRQQSWLQSAALVILGLLTFWPSVSFDFVNWDDPAYIEYNEWIRGWSLSNLKGVATETVTRNYAPVTIFTFLVEYTFWGMNPSGYHATNIVLHVINGVLVFLLIRRLTNSAFVGWTTAALFVIHPVQIESVVWISSRKGLLCSLFMLAALLKRMKPQPDHRDDMWYFILLGFALFSKAHAIVLPPIVLSYDLLIRRQTFAQATPRHVIPAFMSLLLLLLTMGAQNSVLGGVRSHMSLGLLSIIAVDVTILWQYMGMMLWPTDLCVMYDPPTSGIWQSVVVGSIGWAAVSYALWRVRKSHPLWILGALSFLLLLFPMLNFFRITTLMNDRYLYLPCIVAFAMFAGLIERGLQIVLRYEPGSVTRVGSMFLAPLKAGIVVLLLAGCFAATSKHMPVWKNADSLWSHALTQYPNMPIFRIQNALTKYDNGHVQEATVLMKDALRDCQPDDLDRERMQDFVKEWQAEVDRAGSIVNRATSENRNAF